LPPFFPNTAKETAGAPSAVFRYILMKTRRQRGAGNGYGPAGQKIFLFNKIVPESIGICK